MPAIQEPSPKLVSFNCPHCGALAHQSWYDLYMAGIRDDGTPFIPDENFLPRIEANEALSKETRQRFRDYVQRAMRGEIFSDSQVKDRYTNRQLANVFVSRCFSCTKLALWIHENILYPSVRHAEPANEDMPEEIKADYNEASTVLPLSPRSSAAMLRLCIQKLCQFILGQESTGNLYDDIGKLVARGLDVRIQQALDVVRVIGNESVHPGVLDLRDDRDTASKLFGLVNLIADKMISEPKHVEAMYRTIPPEKLAQIAKRDKG